MKVHSEEEMGAICLQWGQFRLLNLFRLHVMVAMLVGAVLVCAPIATAGGLVGEPSASGSGYYSYNGSTMTLTDVKINQITFGFSFGPPYPHPITAPTWVADPVAGTGNDDGAVASLIDITYSGSGYDFSDGTFQLTLGSDVVMTADMVGVSLTPTQVDTAVVNPSMASVNLENVVVQQPSAGTSQFVTDWLTASQGSGLGALQLTFVNTLEGGNFDTVPLDSPGEGSVLLSLQTVTPEPASALLILLGSFGLYRRQR